MSWDNNSWVNNGHGVDKSGSLDDKGVDGVSESADGGSDDWLLLDWGLLELGSKSDKFGVSLVDLLVKLGDLGDDWLDNELDGWGLDLLDNNDWGAKLGFDVSDCLLDVEDVLGDLGKNSSVLGNLGLVDWLVLWVSLSVLNESLDGSSDGDLSSKKLDNGSVEVSDNSLLESGWSSWLGESHNWSDWSSH